MEMTEDQKRKIAENLSSSGISYNCDACGSINSIEIRTKLVGLPSMDGTGKFFGTCVLTCSNCGHTQLFSLDKMGFEESDFF